MADLAKAGHWKAMLLQEFLDAWLPHQFKSGTRRLRSTKAHNGSAHRNYGMQNTASGSRAAAYKKAQDLFHKNKATLVDKMISNTPLDELEITPSLDSVERLYGNLLETPP
nr:unnamed protein product [Callosobruchus analis]